jgi:hypothetical protein
MTERKPWPWYRRIQFEIGGRWQMFPDRNTTLRKWVFDPFYNLTTPGTIITGTNQFPQDIGAFWSDDTNPDKKLRAKFLWFSCGIRVLGLDFGFGIFYRLRAAF